MVETSVETCGNQMKLYKFLKNTKKIIRKIISMKTKILVYKMTFVFSSKPQEVQSGGEIDVLRGLSFCRVGFW